MSWQDYVDNQLMASQCVNKACIAGHDGNIWASSKGFEVSFKNILHVYSRKMPQSVLAQLLSYLQIPRRNFRKFSVIVHLKILLLPAFWKIRKRLFNSLITRMVMMLVDTQLMLTLSNPAFFRNVKVHLIQIIVIHYSNTQ